MYKYAFALGGLYCLAVWGLIYGLAPRSRKVMLWGGLAASWMGPASEYWHRRDYWRPEYLFPLHWGSWTFGLEDLLIAFTFGGVCAGFFDLVVRRWGEKPLAFIKATGAARVFLVLFACYIVTSLLISLFQLNSLYATVLTSVGFGLWFLRHRRQWIAAAFITGLASAALLFISYWGFYFRLFPKLLPHWWLASALSGLMILGVPVEELIWAGSAAFFYGPAFRYCQTPSR